MVPPGLDHLFERSQARSIIGAHSLHIDAYDQLEIRKGPVVRFGIQNLVDLFLIPADDDAAFGMAKDIVKFRPGVGRIDADSHSPQCLRCDVGIQPFRSVLAGNCQTIAAPESRSMKTKGKKSDTFKIAGPGDPVPDPQILFPNGKFIGYVFGPVHQ